MERGGLLTGRGLSVYIHYITAELCKYGILDEGRAVLECLKWIFKIDKY